MKVKEDTNFSKIILKSEDIYNSLLNIRPSVSFEELEKYRELQKKFC